VRDRHRGALAHPGVWQMDVCSGAGAYLVAVFVEDNVADLLRGSACGSGASVGGFPFVRRLIGRS
jgi:hypothetical protein